MEKIKLQVRLREDMSKHHLKEIRKQGFVPGSLYGKDKGTVPLEVGLAGLAEALRTEAGVHAIFDLNIEGAKRGQGGNAVIKQIQKDPLTRKVTHIDFERVSMSDIIQTEVAVVIHGEAQGVKAGGMLEQIVSEVDLKCRADHIPSHLDVDVTPLQIGQFIHAGEIPLPEGCELVTKPDVIVAAVRPPHLHGVHKKEERPEEEAMPPVETTPAGESEE